MAETLNDTRAEQAMLSSVWLSGDSEGYLDKLEQRDFLDPTCRWVLEVLQLTKGRGEPLDPVAVVRTANQVRKPRANEDSNVWQMMELLQSQVTCAHQGYYFRVLREERLRRALLLMAEKLIEKLTEGERVADVADYIEENLEKLRSRLPQHEAQMEK